MRSRTRRRGASLDARRAASLAIDEALRGGAYVGERIRAWREEGRLDPREAGLAREIALGAVRHALLIRRLLSTLARYDERRVAAGLRATLYAAVYQLVWLDRIPAFACVDEAVRIARETMGRRAAGMVNAVLREVARAIAARRTTWERGNAAQVRVDWSAACGLARAVLPPLRSASPHAHVAAATSERLERARLLAARHGAARAEACLWASQATPVVVVHRNPLRADAPAFRASVAALASAEADRGAERPVTGPDAAYLPATVRLADSPLLAEGLAHVQDATAHAAARLVGATPGERVLDLCAAPGGKAIVLAQDLHDRGEVVAADVSDERLARVAENAARMGLRSIRVRRVGEDDELGEEFDAAIVDAPCSNSGVLARRPEARFRLTEANLRSLCATQARLLRRAARTVRRGGRLVYSTCSIEPEENEAIVSAFCRETEDWRLEHSVLTLPSWGASLDAWRDGGFAARLVRRGG